MKITKLVKFREAIREALMAPDEIEIVVFRQLFCMFVAPTIAFFAIFGFPLLAIFSIILEIIMLPTMLVLVLIKKRCTGRIIANYEKELQEQDVLRLEGFDRDDANREYKTMYEFVQAFVCVLNPGRSTYYLSGDLQCIRNCRRSLGDIYLVCRYYYPDCRLEDVLKCLLELGSERRITGGWCGTIHKYVFHTRGPFNANIGLMSGTLEFAPEYDINNLIDYYEE